MDGDEEDEDEDADEDDEEEEKEEHLQSKRNFPSSLQTNRYQAVRQIISTKPGHCGAGHRQNPLAAMLLGADTAVPNFSRFD